MSNLTSDQIEDIARSVAMIQSAIVGFYDNPENERAFQEWYFQKYGHYEGKD